VILKTHQNCRCLNKGERLLAESKAVRKAQSMAKVYLPEKTEPARAPDTPDIDQFIRIVAADMFLADGIKIIEHQEWSNIFADTKYSKIVFGVRHTVTGIYHRRIVGSFEHTLRRFRLL
jgi:hypothetical protein